MKMGVAGSDCWIDLMAVASCESFPMGEPFEHTSHGLLSRSAPVPPYQCLRTRRNQEHICACALVSLSPSLGLRGACSTFALLFLRDNLTANAVSPPAEVALATISPMVAKQNGHIASPLGSGGEA
jgi:hypothetical protein